MIMVKAPYLFGLLACFYCVALRGKPFMQHNISNAANGKRHLRYPFPFVFAKVNPRNAACIVCPPFAVSSVLAVRNFAQVAYAVVKWVLIYVVNFPKHRYPMMHSPDNAVSKKAITVYAPHLSVVNNTAERFFARSFRIERLSAPIVRVRICCSWLPYQFAFCSIANQQLVEVVNGR